MQFVTTERSGVERRLIGRVVASRANELTRVNLRLESPHDLKDAAKDAAYLTRETTDGRDEIYLYLPALNRVRRLTGGRRNNPVFGTDFSYNDLRQIHTAFSGDDLELVGETEIDERTALHLRVQQHDDPEVGPRQLEAWVDRDTCVSLRIDTLDGDAVIKRISSPAQSLKSTPSGEWYADLIRVEDFVSDPATELMVLGIEVGQAISEALFNPRTFYIGY